MVAEFTCKEDTESLNPINIILERPKAPPFKPTVNLSFGYGFPNLDKELFSGSICWRGKCL